MKQLGAISGPRQMNIYLFGTQNLRKKFEVHLPLTIADLHFIHGGRDTYTMSRFIKGLILTKLASLRDARFASASEQLINLVWMNGCQWSWTWPRCSLANPNQEQIQKQPNFISGTTFVSTTLLRNQSLGASLLSAYSWLSLALDLAQMVLDVGKNLKPTQ